METKDNILHIAPNGEDLVVRKNFTGASAKYSYFSITTYANGNYYINTSTTPHKFCQIDISPANARIAGSGNQVVFYNSETSTYNAIQVREVYTYSDEKAKTHISPLSNSLQRLASLKPVSYRWKDEIYADMGEGVKKGANEEIGFLAQDVEAVIPEAVLTDGDDNKLVNYNTIIPLLVDAIKDLQTQIEALKK